MFIYVYMCRHTFQRVVGPCRGQRTSLAQSEPDCASDGGCFPGAFVGSIVYIYLYIYVHIYTYMCRHTFQRVVGLCRGQRTSLAQTEPNCASGRWVITSRALLEMPKRTSHVSDREEPTFRRHSQALTVSKKVRRFPRSFCRM